MFTITWRTLYCLCPLSLSLSSLSLSLSPSLSLTGHWEHYSKYIFTWPVPVGLFTGSLSVCLCAWEQAAQFKSICCAANPQLLFTLFLVEEGYLVIVWQNHTVLRSDMQLFFFCFCPWNLNLSSRFSNEEMREDLYLLAMKFLKFV